MVNPEKTLKQLPPAPAVLNAADDPLLLHRYVSAIGCMSPESAASEFRITLRRWGVLRTHHGYHVIQSFAPYDTVTPDLVHDIGCETASRVFSGHECVVATHLNRPHLHSHIIANSVARDTGKTFSFPRLERSRMPVYDAAWRVTEEITKRNGLLQIRRRAAPPGTWMQRHFNQAAREDINIDIRACAARAENRTHLFELLRELGYDLREDEKKGTMIRPEGAKHYWILSRFYLPWELDVMAETGAMAEVRRKEEMKLERYLRPWSPHDTIDGALTPFEAQILFWLQTLKHRDRLDYPEIPSGAVRCTHQALDGFRRIRRAGIRDEEGLELREQELKRERREISGVLRALTAAGASLTGDALKENARSIAEQKAKRLEISRELTGLRCAREAAARGRFEGIPENDDTRGRARDEQAAER